MKPLTREQAEALLADGGSHCTRFEPGCFDAFASVWEIRRDEARIYRRPDLVEKADAVIDFTQAAGHQNLGLIIASQSSGGMTSFLFNFQTRDHLVVIQEENRIL